MSAASLYPAPSPGKALQNVLCAGCGRPFEPTRRNQKHCRASCRALALQKRRALPLLDADPGDALRREGGFE